MEPKIRGHLKDHIFLGLSVNTSNDRDIKIIQDSNISVKKSQEEGKHSRATGGWKNYSDFELEISPGIGRDYPVTLLHSPAGEGQETMHFPFDELVLENALRIFK